MLLPALNDQEYGSYHVIGSPVGSPVQTGSGTELVNKVT